MKKIFFILITFATTEAFTQEKNEIDSLYEVTMVSELDTTNLISVMDKWGYRTYVNKDSLGVGKYYMIGVESYFNGGYESWRNFLVNNLNISKIGRKLKLKDFNNNNFIQSASVAFTVHTDGSLSDFKVLNEVHPLVKEEALRVIKISPNWKPGIINGKVATTRKIQKITFQVTLD